ncbi:MAG: putative outer membrane protein precursor, OmpA family [Bacteroidetes bacterium]|nr:putative outer membrane protein precursor, OmpA family [Bacteroidota bacterium]
MKAGKINLRVTLLVLLMNTVFVTNAQQNDYAWKTSYDKGDIMFPIGEDDIKNTYVEDGAYYLKLKDATQNYRVYYEVLLDPEKDYSVLTNLMCVEGDSKKWFGMTFGYKDIDNGSYFVIRGDGKFQVFKYSKGKKSMLIDKGETPHITSAGKYNVLSVQKMKDKLYFFINYKMVATIPYYDFPANKFGLYVSGLQTIASDYFYVKQKKDPINLIEGWDKFGIVEKMPSNINSKNGEIMPVVSADEKFLFVTRKPYSKDDSEGNDDIYFATLGKDSNWLPLKPIGKGLNNERHNFVCGVSGDNDELMVGGKYVGGKWVGPGFSRTHRTNDGWTAPKALEIKNYYNDDKYVEMCPSHDFKRIILAVKRKDGHGEKDLYTSVMLPDSTWSEPVNLGKGVNTYGEEDSPFLAPDNITLYFSSNGWPGYGSNDIFMTRRLDDTWMNWTKPKNLGPIVNGAKWDAYYTTSASGKTAYLVRNMSDDNHADIYQVKQPESAKPIPLLVVKGKVINEKTNKPVKAAITYSILGSNVTAGRTMSDDKGEFTITFHKGKKYAFTAHKEGFIAEHKSTDVADLKRYKEVEVDLYLNTFEKGESIIMHNLFFVPDKYEILPESAAELDRLYELLKENKKVKVEIGGHTSLNRSSEKWNMDLSSNRANAVKEYLVKKGIADNRITSKGYGHTKPIETVVDEEHQSKNRRVEFTITEI